MVLINGAGGILMYFSLELMEKPRLQDYKYVYWSKNMWSWLGSGFSARDYDGRDLTWYFGLVDGQDRQRDYDVHEMEYPGAEPAAKVG